MPYFPYFEYPKKSITNYDLYLLPNGIYRVDNIEPNNYLYPVYYVKERDKYYVSTSVYSLIHHKRRFIRNPYFQTTRYYRPTFLTIDQEIMRVRAISRRSTYEVTEKEDVVRLGARLIQEYVAEIETKYPEYIQILLMGGKDSENIILTKRKARWIIVSSEPNAQLNEEFVERNNIKVERFIPISNNKDNTFLHQEIIASDCFYDVSHFRWSRFIHDLVKEYDGKAVLWMGSAGDAIFSYHHAFHRAVDYFAHHELYVGMAMGILHQLFKNFLNIPVLSPYQSPQFLDQLFYRFDPYFVERVGDVRTGIGELLFGGPVWYPRNNPGPTPWERDRSRSIPVYINQLKRDGISCQTKKLQSWVIGKHDNIYSFFNAHSSKRRSPLSKILFPLRRKAAVVFPALRNSRYDIAANKIK